MKKIITAFAMLFCLCSALTFSACSSSDSDRIGELEQRIEELESESTINYEQIEVNANTLRHYIAFNITISDCFVEYIETNALGSRVYNLACVATITTSRAADCHFIGETDQTPFNIKYNLGILTPYGWDCSTTSPSAQVDYNGNSSVSFALWRENTTSLEFPTFSSSTFLMTVVGGYVLVPQEA